MILQLKILKWISRWITKQDHHSECAVYWISQVNKWSSTQGNLNTIKRIKAIRLHVTRYLCGQPLLISAHPGIKLNKKGLPSSLGQLQELIHGNTWDRRYLMTLLSISRCLPSHGAVSVQTITSPGVTTPQTVTNDLLRVLEALNWKLDRPEWERYHFTLKAGPNGQAIMGAIHDAHHLSDHDLEDITILSGSDNLREKIISLRDNFSSEM